MGHTGVAQASQADIWVPTLGQFLIFVLVIIGAIVAFYWYKLRKT